MLEDTKGVILSRKTKDRQYNVQQKRWKGKQWTSKHHTLKTKDCATRTQQKTDIKLRRSSKVSSSCYTSGTHRITLVTHPVIGHERGQKGGVVTTT